MAQFRFGHILNRTEHFHLHREQRFRRAEPPEAFPSLLGEIRILDRLHRERRERLQILRAVAINQSQVGQGTAERVTDIVRIVPDEPP